MFNSFLKFVALLAALVCYGFLVTAQHISDNTQISVSSAANASELKELIAQNMLVYQRNVGGWPKHVDNVKVDYKRKLSEAERVAVKDDSSRNDATIDNGATVKEIRFLAERYEQTGKKEYLKAVEKGLSYLLKAQYPNGGWPQFFPDTSGYRKQITYNDNAMVNVLSLLQDVSLGTHFMNVAGKAYKDPARAAVAKGIDCILKTQVRVNGKLTAWCAQHDKDTFIAAKARAYELPSLSGAESVGILSFLLLQPNPSEGVKQAIVAGVNWLKSAQINGFDYLDIPDASKPKGYDRLLVANSKGVVWARFYDIETNKPFVCGRDGTKKTDLKDIEYERRSGYAWYGTWGSSLLKKYPKWLETNMANSALVN